MNGGVEWLPEPGLEAQPDAAESLRVGSERPPRLLAVQWWWRAELSRRARRGWRLALAAVVAGVGVGAVSGARPVQPQPSAATQAREHALLAQVGGGLAAAELARISITGPSSSCRPAPPGNQATERIAAAVTTRLAGFRVLDRNENFEAGSSLCAATLRLHNDTTGVGLEVVVETPPNPPDGTVVAASRAGGDVLGAVSSVTTQGWRVVIGVSGPAGRVPARAELLALSLDPGLTW